MQGYTEAVQQRGSARSSQQVQARTQTKAISKITFHAVVMIVDTFCGSRDQGFQANGDGKVTQNASNPLCRQPHPTDLAVGRVLLGNHDCSWEPTQSTSEASRDFG